MGKLKNADFYDAKGVFDAKKAKDAYYKMMKSFDYPIPERLRTDDFWALDFGTGRFTEVGMAGVFWVNDKEGDYLGHEIYLLPGQMIPEHWHVKTENARAKMEAWQLRNGSVTLFGEGDASPVAQKICPSSEWANTTVRHCTHLKCGEYGKLNRVEARHFMVAGSEGCIVTEYASFHDMAGLRFTNTKIKL
jgi:D-lyxose ketol-isomerase